jgi:putative peptidoglycan lipid II flippase
VLVAAGILASRTTGIIRFMVMGTVLGGDKAVTDAFAFALRLPNLLQNLLGEGSLSASFIPVYARLVEQDRRREADDLAGAVLALLALLTVAIVVVGLLLSPALVGLFTDWEADRDRFDLAVTLTRITTIGIGFLVISAWCLGILNSHRSFFLSYVAPVVWNGAQIAALVVFGLLAWSETDIAVAVAWAVVVGGIAQVLVQLPRVRRLAPALRPNLTITESLRTVIGRFGPAVGARGVVQISSYADLALAGLLTVGALTWYTWALPLYILPISLFGFSVAAAELAEMSRTTGGPEAVAERLTPALRQVLVPAGLVTAAFATLSGPIIDALYGWLSRLTGRGFTDPADITTIALVLSAFALGLPATMTARVSQNTLYSLGDVRGPARIAVLRLVVSVTLGLVLILQLDWLTFDDGAVVRFGDVPHWPPWERVPEARRLGDAIPPHLGVVGLALAASVASWVEWVALRVRLRRHLGHPVRSGWARQVTLAGVAAGVVMALLGRLPVPSPLDAAVAGVAGVAVYGGALRVQGLPVDPRALFGRDGSGGAGESGGAGGAADRG